MFYSKMGYQCHFMFQQTETHITSSTVQLPRKLHDSATETYI